MATVGSGSAYATDIIAVQRVYYNQTYNFACQSFSSCLKLTSLNNCPCRSMVCCYVDTAHWFLDRWSCTTLLGPTSVHDLAYQPCQLCPVQYFASTTICRYRKPRRYQSWQVFPLHLFGVLLLVWVLSKQLFPLLLSNIMYRILFQRLLPRIYLWESRS